MTQRVDKSKLSPELRFTEEDGRAFTKFAILAHQKSFIIILKHNGMEVEFKNFQIHFLKANDI
jgi:hypothetical protein